jgi:hypothetical protein
MIITFHCETITASDSPLKIHVKSIGCEQITLDNKFQNIFCICDEYVINLFVCIYEVRKGT